LSGKYPIVTGLEHDEMGHPTGAPRLHLQMTAKRRKKLQALAATLPTPPVYGPPEGNVLLVGWGSTQGPIREAVDRARASGDSVSALHIRYISPLPPGLENAFAGFNHVCVVEMNDEGLYGYGQLAALLRARYCDPKIHGINKTDGLTWKVREILDRVKTTVSSGLRKL
jgi:2-oxoglutarate ferredoxin oxidoreductase subunit alpha